MKLNEQMAGTFYTSGSSALQVEEAPHAGAEGNIIDFQEVARRCESSVSATTVGESEEALYVEPDAFPYPYEDLFGVRSFVGEGVAGLRSGSLSGALPARVSSWKLALSGALFTVVGLASVLLAM